MSDGCPCKSYACGVGQLAQVKRDQVSKTFMFLDKTRAPLSQCKAVLVKESFSNFQDGLKIASNGLQYAKTYI